MSDTNLFCRKVLKVIKLQTYHIREKTVYALKLSAVDFSDVNPNNNVSFNEGQISDLPGLANGDLDYNSMAVSFAKERLKQGDKLIIGYIRNRPVCYGWLMFNQMDLQFRHYRPTSNGTAYSYKIYVAPDVRRMGVYQAYYQYIIEYLRKQNSLHLITWIDNLNQASISAHLKFGVKPIGKIYSRTLFGYKQHRLASDNALLSQKSCQ